ELAARPFHYVPFLCCDSISPSLWSVIAESVGFTNNLGGSMPGGSTETAARVAVPAPAAATAVMKTILQQFSASFDASMRPLLEPLQTAAAALATAPEQLSAQNLAPRLRELHHQIDSL